MLLQVLQMILTMACFSEIDWSLVLKCRSLLSLKISVPLITWIKPLFESHLATVFEVSLCEVIFLQGQRTREVFLYRWEFEPNSSVLNFSLASTWGHTYRHFTWLARLNENRRKHWTRDQSPTLCDQLLETDTALQENGETCKCEIWGQLIRERICMHQQDAIFQLR